MRLGLRPDGLAERIALALGLVPTPFLQTHPGLLLTRALLVATERDFFEALAEGSRSAASVAEACGTHPEATGRLLDTLAGSGYLRRRGDDYTLTRLARTWLLRDSPRSLRDSLLFRKLEWDWIARLDAFVDDGEPIDFHAAMTAEEWRLYQRGMHALARLAVPETVRRAPVPAQARDLLDVGGAHGTFSAAFCARYPRLHAVVLDLPQAVAESAPLLDATAEAAGVAERVAHRAGDALEDDLGADAFDVVFVGQLLHHFEDEEARRLIERLARALRPGGVLILQDVMRAQHPDAADQLGTLADLYFALTSAAGTRSFETLAAWQREAGLLPRRPVRFRTLPGVGQQNAMKPE